MPTSSTAVELLIRIAIELSLAPMASALATVRPSSRVGALMSTKRSPISPPSMIVVAPAVRTQLVSKPPNRDTPLRMVTDSA